MKNGIVAAGNWIIDHVKMIDTLPDRGMLANIGSTDMGIGGCAHNVLVDLAKLQTGIPLYASGVVGNDANGDFIRREIKNNGIDDRFMYQTDEKPTSFTDVMTEVNTGHRTFFHYRGANALLDVPHIEKVDCGAKIFHLGYLLLLDKLDEPDETFGIVAARVLSMLKHKSYITSVDVVSEQSNRFTNVVKPCLQFIDYLIVNEIEAGNSAGITIRETDGKINGANLRKTAEWLIDNGVGKIVVIHFPEGGYALTKDGRKYFEPSYKIDSGEIVSSVGAGDAFCAGMLYALHQNLPIDYALKLANANARFNLKSATSAGGAKPLTEVELFIKSAMQNEMIAGI